MPKKTAFITGATSGIGWATALRLHQADFRIIATGRREDRLSELAQLLPEEDILTLCFDVRQRDAVQKAVDSIPPSWQSIDLLINNAGNAHGLEVFQEGSWEDWAAMMDINVLGLMAVTEAVLPFMLSRGKGHIINLGSIAGDQAYAKGAVYCASKAAVSLFTQGLRLDLNSAGIKVSELKAGMVETEFSLVRFKGDQQKAAQVYSGLQPLSAEDIADTLCYMAMAPHHVNLAEVLMLPLAQASAHTFHRKV